MKYLNRLLLVLASASFFYASAQAQNAGTIPANEIPVGKGPGVQGFGSTYTPAGTGAVARGVRSKLNEVVSVTDFGADCAGSVDSTTAVSNAIAALGAGGGTINIPNSCFVKIGGSGTQIFLITTPIRFKCQGLGSGGFVVTGTTSATTDIFRIAPASNTTLYQTGMSGCQVIPLSGTPGRHVWNFDTSGGGPTTVISEFLAEDNYFGTFGNYVFFNNTSAGTNSGGIYSSHFVRNVCAGSGSATAGGCFGGANWGDSNHVNGGRMAGTGYAVNISLFAAGGAGNFILENANIVSSSMIKIDGGYKPVIQNNTIEQQLFTNTSANNAVIDLNGGAAAVINATIVGNLVVVGSGLGNPIPIRINNAAGTHVDGNRLATAIDQNAISDAGTNTYIGPSNIYSGPVAAAPVTNSGTTPLFIARNGVNVGIGKESAPQIPLAISQNTRQALAWPAGTNVGVIGVDGTVVTQAIQSNGAATFPQYVGYMSRGTANSPTATQSGDTLAAFGGGGYTGSAFSLNAYFSTSAAENWTSAHKGTYASIYTTPTGTTTQAEVVRVFASGGVGIGSFTDPGAGNIAKSGDIVGASTNSNAAAGMVGEVISSSIPVGSAVSLVNGTAKDITTITLTAGDWDVWGNFITNPAGTTTTSGLFGWISTTANTIPPLPNGGAYAAMVVNSGAGLSQALAVGTMRLSLSTTTTVSLTTLVNFQTSTMGAYGFIGARRRR